jgi:predicted transcriptional regulator
MTDPRSRFKTDSTAEHDESAGTPPSPEQDRSSGASLHRGLGQREREIMEVLWELGSASVQQVSERLSTALAYTTVMTTLDRLFKKGVLQRQKKDRAFIYSAVVTAREVEGQRAAGLIRRFFSDSSERPDILLSCLVDAVHHYDTNLLNQLEAKIRAARAAHLVSGLEPGEGS